MYTLLVLADDLTGALDTAVKFAKRGIPAQVLVRWKGAGSRSPETEAPPGGGVLVINTNTRHCPAAEARSTVMQVLERYSAVPYVYKKTDSTLRGNIGAELEALVLGRKLGVLPFAPAYPDLGRHTRGGRQYLDGVPIDQNGQNGQSGMAADLLNPIGSSFIPDIIAEGSALPTRLIPRGVSAPAPARVPPSAGPEIWIYDAESGADLRDIARSLAEQELLGAAAGCAGFAEPLADCIPFDSAPFGDASSGDAPLGGVSAGNVPCGSASLGDASLGDASSDDAAGRPEAGPVLIISGSRHPASLAQVEAAMGAGIPGIAVEGDKLLRPRWFEGEEAASIIKRCGELLDTGCCILGTRMSLGREAAGPEMKPVSEAGEAPASGECAEAQDTAAWGAAGGLGRLAGPILARRPAHLVVFGGDTLLGVMEFLGCPLLSPVDEILPGLVLAGTGAGDSPAGPGCLVVTKSGAFGGPDLIAEVLEFLRRPFASCRVTRELPMDAAQGFALK